MGPASGPASNAVVSAARAVLEHRLAVGDEHTVEVEIRERPQRRLRRSRDQRRRDSVSGRWIHTRRPPPFSGSTATTASPNASARACGMNSGISRRRGLPTANAWKPWGSSSRGAIG